MLSTTVVRYYELLRRDPCTRQRACQQEEGRSLHRRSVQGRGPGVVSEEPTREAERARGLTLFQFLHDENYNDNPDDGLIWTHIGL